METIGEKLTEVRKRKGLSQEALSDLAKINLRTLQRIEAGESEPRGHTLKSLCDVLEINIEDILDYGKKEDRKYLIYLHLSVIMGLFIPVGDIIVPLILWLTQKDKIISLDKQGKNILNFRICWDGLSFIFIFFNLTSSNRSFFGLVFIIHVLITCLYPIIVAIMLDRRENLKLYYPKWIRIIR